MATKPPAASSMSAGTVSAPVPAVTSAGGTAGGTAGGPAAAGTATGTGGGTLDGSTTAGADQQTRGLPYYEKLRRELRETIQKKRLLDKNMAMLEDSIYRFEQSYLEETGAGNIIKGFDNYIKGAIIPSTLGGVGGSSSARRKAQVNDADRVFSRNSVSFSRDSPAPGSNTPSHAGTPASSIAAGASGGGGGGSSSSKGGNKKKKASSTAERRDRDSETPKPPVKRLKITYGRD